jgi:hypothetical protein
MRKYLFAYQKIFLRVYGYQTGFNHENIFNHENNFCPTGFSVLPQLLLL